MQEQDILDPEGASWIQLQLLLHDVPFPQYFHLKLAAIRAKGLKESAQVELELLKSDHGNLKGSLERQVPSIKEAVSLLKELHSPIRALYLSHLSSLNMQLECVDKKVVDSFNVLDEIDLFMDESAEV